jgi:hypothetical protein
MLRLVAVVAGALSLAGPAAAKLDELRLDPPRLGDQSLAAFLRVRNTVPAAPPPVAELTRETRVFLNGRPCSYADVPPGASVTFVELDAGGEKIVRIEFRTEK